MDYSDRFDEFFMYHFGMDGENISVSDCDEKYFLKISPLALNGRSIISRNLSVNRNFNLEPSSLAAPLFEIDGRSLVERGLKRTAISDPPQTFVYVHGIRKAMIQ